MNKRKSGMTSVSLGETFSASVEWTKTMFFRPFSFKKWAVLFIIAMLAFEFQGGLSLRFNNTYRGPVKKDRATQTALSAPVGGGVATTASAAPATFITKETFSKYKPLLIALGIVVLLLVLLMWWLRSVFLFVFLEAIANNDASIKGPFVRNVRLGNSYFVWTLLVAVLMLLVIAIPVKLGYDTLAGFGVFIGTRTAPLGAIAVAVLPHILSLMALLVIGGLISFFLEDYASLVMYKKRISLPNAISPAAGLVFLSFLTTIKYIFLKVGLVVAISIISTVVSFLMLITFLSPMVIVGFALGTLYKIIPAPVRAIFFVILALAGLPVIAAIVFVANVIFTPLSVFYKTFNIKFIARLDEKYDLFKLT